MSLPPDLVELFADVEPLEQDEGPDPCVQIAYSDDFKVAMDYFRRVLVTGEFSSRTLLLAATVIENNAANYTAWQYRRKCLREMHGASDTPDASDEQAPARRKAWEAELRFCNENCWSNMKNYQVWFHRRACIEALGVTEGELDFIASVLEDDAKNYHAWGHRQWVLKTFSLWEKELEYCDVLLQQDLRNNSAWNQRYYVLSHTADLKEHDLVRREIAYALKYIDLAPSNASPWNYLKGVVEPVGFGAFPEVQAACERLGAAEGTARGRCAHALALLVDVRQSTGRPEELAAAVALCAELAKLDPIRVNYWTWRGAGGCSCAPNAVPPNAAKEAPAVAPKGGAAAGAVVALD